MNSHIPKLHLNHGWIEVLNPLATLGLVVVGLPPREGAIGRLNQFSPFHGKEALDFDLPLAMVFSGIGPMGGKGLLGVTLLPLRFSFLWLGPPDAWIPNSPSMMRAD